MFEDSHGLIDNRFVYSCAPSFKTKRFLRHGGWSSRHYLILIEQTTSSELRHVGWSSEHFGMSTMSTTSKF